MNTVSSKTLAAEETLKTVWGDMAGNVVVMLEGEDIDALQALSDEVAGLWEQHLRSGFLRSGFTPSMILPGEHRARKNLAAWKDFWTESRQKTLKKDLDEAAEKYGFSPEAFAPFLEQIRAPRYRVLEIPETLHDFFGISRKPEGKGWRLLSSAIPGENYDARVFFETNRSIGIRVFDPNYFSSRLAVILADTFTRMLLVIALGVFVLLILLFFSWPLILLTLAPLVFSLVCTLATLRLTERAIDIPSLMLAIVIFGMGVDYGILLVRSQQRFFNEHHPSQGPIRTAVFLAAASTMLGMGALTASEHAVLRSAGMTSFLGIGYSALGAFILLPPVLSRLFSSRFPQRIRREPGSAGHRREVLRRFKLLEPYPRLFARFKMLTDVMFPRLAQWVKPSGTVLDIGCGFGIPAVWLLTCYPELRFVGIEPDAGRVRVAERVIGPDGYVVHTSAQELPPEPAHVDTVLMLDVADHLSDEDLSTVLKRLSSRLVPEGSLVMRIPMPAEKSCLWKQIGKALRPRLSRRRRFLRASGQICSILKDAGFITHTIQPAEKGRNVTWYIASPSPQENPTR
jgi:SAM-dependent methyltransferase